MRAWRYCWWCKLRHEGRDDVGEDEGDLHCGTDVHGRKKIHMEKCDCVAADNESQ